jgi:plasmid stability protein
MQMPDILVRGVKPDVVRRLKAKAKRDGRSLQGEVKILLEKAAASGPEDIAQLLEFWQKHFAGRKFSSSAEIIREARDR